MILPNPLIPLFPEVKRPSHQRPQDEAQSRTWESLGSAVAFLDILLRIGEWHRETIGTNPQKIPHNLRRKPKALIPTMPADGSVFFYAPGGKEAWDAETITLQASAKLPSSFNATFEFVLL